MGHVCHPWLEEEAQFPPERDGPLAGLQSKATAARAPQCSPGYPPRRRQRRRFHCFWPLRSHPTFFERAPELAAALRTQKLENCGVVCAELELGGGRAPPIVDAHLMLGSQLEEKKKATLLGR